MPLDQANSCRYCGHFHGDLCPQVKAFEYDEKGEVKRVEFFAPIDHIHPELLEAARKIVESQS
jgi:hypothetical protein